LGTGSFQGQLSGFFSSISDDELSHISPGEMLLYLTVEHCSNENFDTFDLGRGDERYKRSWCQTEIALQDVVFPLSFWARPVTIAIGVWSGIKRIMRTNTRLWAIVRGFRKLKAQFIGC